jgi:hypothetical protein
MDGPEARPPVGASSKTCLSCSDACRTWVHREYRRQFWDPKCNPDVSQETLARSWRNHAATLAPPRVRVERVDGPSVPLVCPNLALTRQVRAMRHNCAGDDAAAATPRAAWLARQGNPAAPSTSAARSCDAADSAPQSARRAHRGAPLSATASGSGTHRAVPAPSARRPAASRRPTAAAPGTAFASASGTASAPPSGSTSAATATDSAASSQRAARR